jgi:hypothetical protein
MRVCVLVYALVMLICSGVVADDFSAGSIEAYQFPPPFRPYSSLAAGLSVRLDDQQRSNEMPTLRLRWLYYGRPGVAPYAGLSYTISSDWGVDRRFTSFEFELGVRFQDIGKYLSLHFDPGVSFMRYIGVGGWSGLSESRTGLSVGTGFDLHLSSVLTLTAAIRQVINRFGPSERDIILEGPRSTPLLAANNATVSAPRFIDKIFNPTSLDIQIEFKL